MKKMTNKIKAVLEWAAILIMAAFLIGYIVYAKWLGVITIVVGSIVIWAVEEYKHKV